MSRRIMRAKGRPRCPKGVGEDEREPLARKIPRRLSLCDTMVILLVISDASSNRRKLSVTCCSPRDFICSFVIHTIALLLASFRFRFLHLRIDAKTIILYACFDIPAQVVYLVSFRLSFDMLTMDFYPDMTMFVHFIKRHGATWREYQTRYVETREHGFKVYERYNSLNDLS